MSTFLTLTVVCAVCFAFKPLHAFGVALLALLLLAYPAPGFTLLAIAGITYLFIKRK
ncbi:MAG: hypothetical protein GY934_12530 [Gammaproteobacteria bacterium]|nr:hypothetical protein [Gammaproteobacteria bacterium]